MVAIMKLSIDDFNRTDINHEMNHKFWNIVATERYILLIQALLECCFHIRGMINKIMKLPQA